MLGVGIIGQIVYQCVKRRLHIAEGSHGAYEMIAVSSTAEMPCDCEEIVDATSLQDEEVDSLAPFEDTGFETENAYVVAHGIEGLPLMK